MRRVWWCFALLTFGVTTGFAQVQPPEKLEGRPVRLVDLLKHSLERNLTYRQARLQPDLQQATVLQAKAPFQLQMTSNISTSSRETPTASQLAGAPTLIVDETNVDLGFNQQLSWGTLINLTLRQTRSKTNSIFATLNPQYNASFTISLTQPLLRGFGPQNAQASLKSAEKRLESAYENLKESEMDLLQQVATAYWDLAFAHHNYQVQVNSLKLAEKVLHDTEIQIRVGVKAPIEKTSAEAEVALRRQNVVQALNLVQQATDQLKSLVESTDALMTRLGEIWVPMDNPPTPEELPPIDAVLEEALKHRSSLIAARQQLEAARTEYNAAKNGTLPELNLVASYTFNGLGGDRLILGGDFFNRQILGIEKGQFTDALNQVFRGQFPSWSVGLQLTWPINDTAAQSRLLQAEVQFQQAQINYELERQRIVLQVRNAYRELLAARQSLEAAEASVKLQRANLDAESKKLELGLSTNFILLQYQNNLAQAESQLFQAQTNYAKAWVALLRAVGKLNPNTVMNPSAYLMARQ